MDGKTCYTDKKEAIAMTTLSIQVDEKVEKEAEKLFSDSGSCPVPQWQHR